METTPTETKNITRIFSRTPSSWDPQDDLLLRHLKEEQKLGWKEIASHFSHRTPNACQFRWRRLRSGALKNGADKDKGSEKSNSDSGSVTPGIVSMKSASPSTSPDPIMAASYTKFQSLPNAANKRSTTADAGINNRFSFSGSKIATKPHSLSKRRNSSKIEPTDLATYSSSSSVESDEDDVKSNGTRSTSLLISDWTHEEDELILARKERQLTFAELSILLPRRTEMDINSRINELEKSSKSTSAIDPSPVKLHQRHSQPVVKKSSRSFSSSSNSIPLSALSTSRTRSFSKRSKSFSLITPPYFTTAPATFQERYYAQRKNSITVGRSVNVPSDRKNSMIAGLMRPRYGSLSESMDDPMADSSDEEDFVTYNTSNIRVEPIVKTTVGSMGSLVNEL